MRLCELSELSELTRELNKADLNDPKVKESLINVLTTILSKGNARSVIAALRGVQESSIFETRPTQLQYLQSLFPNMPSYVLYDFVYKALKNPVSHTNYRNELKRFVEEYKDYKWRRETLDVALSIFDQETQRRIKERAGGTKNPMGATNDEARHSTQQKLIAAGPSSEPIIVLKTPQGYELVEGWHRTIQSLQKWPKGYKQLAWVGYK